MQVLFYCPDCAFSKEISQSDIPPTAKQCRCPSCRKLFDLTEAVKPLESNDCTKQDIEEKPVESQQNPTDKGGKSLDKYHELLDRALSKLNANDDLDAMYLFEEAEKLRSTPKARSYLAYCRAKVKFEFSDALRVCTQALKEEPRIADHYLNLSRIYLFVNKRGPALQLIRKGLRLGSHPQLKLELKKFEKRKQPVFSSLPRDHILNRKLGKFLSRLGVR